MSPRTKKTAPGPGRTQKGSRAKAGERRRRPHQASLSSGTPSRALLVADLERYMADFLAARARKGWSPTGFLHAVLDLADFASFARSLPAEPPVPDGMRTRRGARGRQAE
jgi:hypothetical protein